MRHAKDGRQLGRNTSHRKAMFQNLANSVLMEEQVTTTVPKAKEVRRVVDRLVTLGKKNTVQARRLAFDRTRDRAVVTKLFSALAERYKSRNGGYTRVLKISQTRRGDGAEMAILEMVDHPPLKRKRKPLSEDELKKKSEAQAEASNQVGDPYDKFRKLFSGTRQKGKKAKTAAKSAKAEKKAEAKEKKASAKSASSASKDTAATAKKKTAKKKK